MTENEKTAPSYTPPSAQEVQHVLTQQNLQNALQLPGLSPVLLDKISPAYFAKKYNNFHLKLYHDPKVRAGYGLETPEMQAFLQTQQGERISKVVTYNYITRGIQAINYFIEPINYSMAQSPTQIGEYLQDLVVEIELKLKKVGLGREIPAELHTREAFYALLEPYLLDVYPDEVLSPGYVQSILPQILRFFTAYFQRVTDEELINLQYHAFQYCIAHHLQQPGIAQQLSLMNEEEIETYLWERYFQ